jgi:hypothetical protein
MTQESACPLVAMDRRSTVRLLRGPGKQYCDVTRLASRLGAEGIISKHCDHPHRSGPSKASLKTKNPAAPAISDDLVGPLAHGSSRNCSIVKSEAAGAGLGAAPGVISRCLGGCPCPASNCNNSFGYLSKGLLIVAHGKVAET